MRSERPGADTPLPIHLVGNVNLDLVLGPVEPWPRPGTEWLVPRQEVRAGGAAGVAALALQGLAAPFQLHAGVGDDAFGALVRRDMGPVGAQLQAVRGSTAYSVGITHPGGERTFLTYQGHLRELDVEGVADVLAGGPPGLLLVCGFFLLPPLRGGAGVALLRRARQAGYRTLFDPGWPSEGFTAEVRRELGAVLPWIDLALPNEAEVLGWTGEVEVEAALRALRRAGGGAVVKRGGAGAIWLEDGEARRRAPRDRVHVADTVGAGDCFNAGLLAALSRRAALGDAVGFAVDYAAMVVGRQPRDYRP